ncbi:MAG: undecaprenyl-diphosphate phosphatase [Holosporales bacterium]|nr:undecaprenyl-diphosphate phosphatase [Holosporales bacterium]
MNFSTVFLGVIQGVSEILPVSSSVNLHFFSSIFNIAQFSFSLKIALHTGSLAALLIFFRKEIMNALKGLFCFKSISKTYCMPLILGTAPVIILGFLAKNFVREFDAPKILGISSIIFGLLLVAFDKVSGQIRRKNTIPTKMVSLIVGSFQSISIFPGVSRLGICITASRMLKMERKKAIQFSLLLAIPSIAGSLTLELLECYKNRNFGILFNESSLIGILTTMITSLIVIHPSIKYMEKRGFVCLAIYRVIIGALICFL